MAIIKLYYFYEKQPISKEMIIFSINVYLSQRKTGKYYCSAEMGNEQRIKRILSLKKDVVQHMLKKFKKKYMHQLTPDFRKHTPVR